jgi:hypothetical protein
MAEKRDLFAEGVLVDIDCGYWSGMKKLQAKDLGLNEDELPEVFSLGRKRLVPTEALSDIRHLEGRARDTVDAHSFKFPIGKAAFVPIRRFGDLAKILDDIKEQFDRAAARFCREYEEYQNAVRKEYRTAADLAYEIYTSRHGGKAPKEKFVTGFLAAIEAAYPTVSNIRARFHFSWSVFEISLPGRHSAKRVEVAAARAESAKVAEIERQKGVEVQAAAAEYRRRVEEKIGEFVGTVVVELRQRVIDTARRIADLARNGNLRSSSIDSLKEFVERFRDLNFAGDSDIEKRLDDLKKNVLNGHTAEQIRDDAEARKALVQALDGVADAAKELTDAARIRMANSFSVGRLVG